MTFLEPLRLLLLVPIAGIVVLYAVMQHRRRRHAVRFTSFDLLDKVAPRRPGWRRHVAAALAGIAAIGMVVGLARPTVADEVARQDAIVVLAIDTSLSMDATDVDPSRLDAAVAKATDFVESLPETVRVGLVAFDGSARVLAAPTDDHDAVTTAIDGLRTGRGTAGGDAIQAALLSIESATTPNAFAGSSATDPDTDGAPAATIVFLSDGATTQGSDPIAAARIAAESSVPVSTITYGTDAGEVTVDGETIPVPPDAETMERIADLTGGTAFEAGSADELAAVYTDLEGVLSTETEQREITLAFVAVALVALMTAAAASLLWTGRFP